MTSQQFCTFYLDDLYFGIQVLDVQEVIMHQEMTHVPLASDMVRGLINLRGQIVTALDLRRRLSLPPRSEDSNFMNVIINAHDSAVSLLVDEVGDVIEVNENNFEPPPHHMQSSLKSLLHGVYKLEQGILLILNTEKTVDID